MRKDLDYGLLHAMNAFVHVMDGGSFTAAAEHLGMSKAQVSRLVTLLEDRLQAKLLHRSTRRIAATEAGERYAAHCKTILDMVAQAEGEVGGGASEPSGRLRVTSMTAFGNRYVTPLVSAYCAANSRVTVEYSSSQSPPDLLAEGIDVSIYLAQYLPDSALVALKLGRMFSVLCAAPDYLERRGTPQHPNDLGRHTCLRLVNSSFTSSWQLDRGTERATLDPQGPLVGNTTEVLLDGALSGMGIVLLPAYSVVDDLRSGKLVQILPGWRSPEIGIFALLPSGRFVDAKTRAWIDLLKEALPPAIERDMAYFAAPAADS
ncbi:LysR family transcriptional regulator [Massilia sp. WF1]|uniref:LysR family transcriptional regulator n=1 Tax=unclassified Massilia TaxID=2609279 RepID=UPI000649CB7C|nr:MULTISPECIES: LysR family transcriptional regulator [unclassified Massilia]ALK95627.1 LysR family transcriptional regulator [Massilia sp. WG5]KLU35289.1 LysR family transcriptional regulator [Massilia sp. WF1]